MWSFPLPPRVVLVSILMLSTACATSPAVVGASDSPVDSQQQTREANKARQQLHATPAGQTWAEPQQVVIRSVSEHRLQLAFPVRGAPAEAAPLRVQDVRPLLAAFESFRPKARPRLRLMLEHPVSSGTARGPVAPWEPRLREEFLARYGPSVLPLPASLETSRLFLALQLSTRYMDEGIRDAAQELFSAPAFVASVTLSVLVYFAAWAAPEPLFSKAFAAALTVRLALLVGVVELGRLAEACLLLNREAEAAVTQDELEAAAERFGRAVGGTALRVLVVVASLGVPQVLPKLPPGGLWTLLSPLRHAPAGGAALESISTAQVVADGSILVTGVAAGVSAVSLCGELAHCAVMGGSSGGTSLSTRYGGPHTRKNPSHNETIEAELSRRDAAGHADLRKNQPQVDARSQPVQDPRPAAGIRFRKPDAASVRPDGVRHNTNYVSSSRDMKRELDAFDSMVRADPEAIHELYLLDGTLMRRYVPPGVGFP